MDTVADMIERFVPAEGPEDDGVVTRLDVLEALMR